MSHINLESWDSIRDSSWWCFFDKWKNSKQYELWGLWMWRIAVDCNACLQWAIEIETNHTCWWDFWLYFNGERVDYDKIPELYDYQRELISIWWECDVPSIWNHAYKFNMEKHTVGEVITYPRLSETGEVSKMWIANGISIRCSWNELIYNWGYWSSKIVDYYNKEKLRLRTIHKTSASSNWTCWTSTIKTIRDKYIQHATMSNMFIHYLENNGLHWITYLLKSADEAWVSPEVMKKMVQSFLKWLRWPENSGKKLATWLVKDVIFPPSSKNDVIDEQTSSRIEDWMLKPFKVPKELLWVTSEFWWYSKYNALKKIYDEMWGIKARWLYQDTINHFNKKFQNNLRYPELSLYKVKCEREEWLDIEHALLEAKEWLITTDEYREMIWREPIKNDIETIE